MIICYRALSVGMRKIFLPIGAGHTSEGHLTMRIKPVNPVAKAVAVSRRRTQVVPDKTKYNRNKDKEQTNAEVKKDT